MSKGIEFSIEEGDIRDFEADVAALKYAQGFFGADRAVAYELNKSGVSYDDMSPQIGEAFYLETHNSIQSPHALFVGVRQLAEFGYQEIREFSTAVLTFLSQKASTTKHLAMTIHGPGYGLDETESLFAQFTGCLLAIQDGKFPSDIEKITIVERAPERVKRLRHAFEKDISIRVNFNLVKITGRWAYLLTTPSKAAGTRSFRSATHVESAAGVKSEDKPHAFVAMPFRKDMEDTYYYGIQSAVHANNLLCERVDKETFTGDILNRVKKGIERATVVVAELSGANPNVYLEVGYAWGNNIPTILAAKKSEELLFDVRGQKCLKYETIRELEESLTEELSGLLGR
jgi:hypothetical protein